MTTPSTIRARLGIDGGGTKTALILVDEMGQLLAQTRVGGSSPSLNERDTIYQLLTENIRALIAQIVHPLTITHTCLCMAGSRIFWRDLAASLSGLGQVQVFDDSIPILELATNGEPGLGLHTGTGSFIVARGADGEAHYAGGLGWRLGDPGSAQDLGRRAAERALLEAQGWLPPSPLGVAVHATLKANDIDGLIRKFYAEDGSHNTPEKVATLAPLVTEHASRGDAVAIEIFRTSVSELAKTARAVSETLFPRGRDAACIPVGLSGPILQSALARQIVAEVLGPTHRLHAITQQPLEGLRLFLTRL